ncbi:MAG: UvrD-helicase domain-containing protein [Patescibacteria group bacterium]|nr:UvrD-helicase domain-containing protein [Patescibacteria group bacterium]
MDNLNDKQLEAVQHDRGPLLIAAGAGSGKTKTLVSRLIHLLGSGIAPENIVAITFTNKAANEMRSRVFNSHVLPQHASFRQPETRSSSPHRRSEKIQRADHADAAAEVSEKSYESQTLENKLFVGTFHSFGAKILKNEADSPNGAFGRTKYFTIFDSEDSLSIVKKIIKEKALSKDRFNPISILSKISEIKNELKDMDEISENAHEAKISAIYEEYEDVLKKSNAFDFDDLITKTVQLFKNEPRVLEKYREKYKYILIDEYQDINTAQYQLIKLLAEKHQNIFAIGDDAQSIYKFRGSDFRNFLNFELDWPKAKIIKLEQNYRSTAMIISASSELIKNNKQQKPKDLWTKNGEGEQIKLSAYENADEEAWGICGKILEMVRAGAQTGEMGILYRTNAQSRAVEQVFIRNKIPYEIYGGLKFYARKEIKDIIAGLRYAYNPKDAASAERLEKSLGKIKSRTITASLPELTKELTLVQIISYFIENTDYSSYLVKNFKNPSERMENIKELINFASQYEDPYKFLEEVALTSTSDDKPKLQKNAVKLMTIHAAKGLEFENVFLIGCNEGLLPHEQSFFKAEDIEEERRLMYVAMTRAKKKLFISFYNLPSRFLGELPGDVIEFTKISSYGERNADWDDETIYIE